MLVHTHTRMNVERSKQKTKKSHHPRACAHEYSDREVQQNSLLCTSGRLYSGFRDEASVCHRVDPFCLIAIPQQYAVRQFISASGHTADELA